MCCSGLVLISDFRSLVLMEESQTNCCLNSDLIFPSAESIGTDWHLFGIPCFWELSDLVCYKLKEQFS